MAFLVNPFLFFYYEEKEDEERTKSKVYQRNEWFVFPGKSFSCLENLFGHQMDHRVSISSDDFDCTRVMIDFLGIMHGVSFPVYSSHKLKDYQTIIPAVIGMKWNIYSSISIPQVNTPLDSKRKAFHDISGLQDSVLFTIFTISIVGFFLLTLYTVRNSIWSTKKYFVGSRVMDRLLFPCFLFVANEVHDYSKKTSKNDLLSFKLEFKQSRWK